MPKRRNSIVSNKISLTTTPVVLAYLEQLVAGGLYGKNNAEAAERLLARGIEALIKDGSLQRASSKGRK